MLFLRRTAPIVIWATLIVAMHWYIRQWDVLAVIGSFTLHVADLSFALTMVYCGAWALGRWRYSPLEYLNLMLCGIIVLNFARGVEVMGASAAGVAFRLFSGYVATSLFVFMMYRRVDIDWVFDKIVLLGWGITLLSVARIVFGLNAFISPEMLAADPWNGGLNRTLDSGGALMLGEAALIVLSRAGALPAGPKRRRMIAIFLVFFVMVLLSDQRTATAATLAGIVVVLATLPWRRRRIVFAGGTLAVVIAGTAVFGMWIANDGNITLPQGVTIVSDDPDQSTYEWRVKQWQDSIELYWNSGLVDQTIGLPLAQLQSIASRLALDRLDASIHSGYFELLLNSGIVGVILFIAVLVAGVTKGIIILSRRTGGTVRPDHVGLAIAILVSHAVYSYAYLLPNEQGLLLAIALQIVVTAPRLVGRPVLSRRNSLDPRGKRLGSGIGAKAPVSLRATASEPS